MKTLRSISALLALLALLTGCHHSVEMDPAFLEKDGLSLKVGKKTVITYDPLTWQLGYTASLHEFSVFTDDMSSYYIVTCKTDLPARVGDAVDADLEWTEGGSIKKESNLRFVVKQFGEDGRVWLWNGKEGIGVVIQTLH